MTGAYAIVRRDLFALANSAIGWVVAALSLALSSGAFFWVNAFLARDVASLDAYFATWPALLAFLIPALTMRVFAEERSNGMDEMIGVLPISTGRVVVAKFASLGIYLFFVMVMTVPVPLGVSLLGELSPSLVFVQYVALLLLGLTMVSVGLFVSSLCASQLLAYVLTTLVLFGLSFLDSLPLMLGLGAQWVEATRLISLDARYGRLSQGLLDVADIVFFAAMVAIFLRAATHAIHARRYVTHG